MRRDSILNYLHRITSSLFEKHHRQTSTLSGIKGSFTLSIFDEFVNMYKITHQLALESEKAFDVLIDSLNQYFNLIEDVTSEDVKATSIKWYTNAIIRGINIIRAKSNYYNTSEFSNIAVNMNEKEAKNYNTVDGTCFAKVN